MFLLRRCCASWLAGSWDASIRSWDWPRSRPLLVCREHHADVYGLDIHPARPWLLASASRDTTTRLWDLTPWLAAPLWAAGLAGQPLPRGQVGPWRSMHAWWCGACMC